LRVTLSLGAPGSATPALTAPAPQRLTQTAVAEGRFGGGFIPSPFSARFSAAALSPTPPSWRTHLALALARHLAYADAATVEGTARGLWGLETCELVEGNATRCFIATTPRVVLIAFRGTVDLANWLANLNVLSKGRPYGLVHRGFFHAFADVQSLLERRLDDVANRPVLLTGHSLGGALASIAAAEWQ